MLGATLGLAALIALGDDRARHAPGLIHDDHRDETQPFASPAGLGFTAVFLLSVPAAFLSVHIAEALWISTVVLRYPLRRLGGRTTSR